MSKQTIRDVTEKEIGNLFAVGAVLGAVVTVSTTRPGSWHLAFDLAPGVSVPVVTARGDLKNYTLDTAAALIHSLGLDRFTVGLHGYAQK